MYVLVLEASTTSAKALLYNKRTKTYQMKITAFDKFSSNGKKHNVKSVLHELIKVGKDVISDEVENKVNYVHKDKLLPVESLVIITTWHNLLWMDKDFQPVGEAYLWSYKNKVDIKATSHFSINGCPVSISYPLYKGPITFRGLCDEEKEKVAYLGDEASYFMYRLTGSFSTSPNLASGTGFYHLLKGEYEQEIINQVEKSIDKQSGYIKLPVITNQGFDLDKNMARELGIEGNVSVYSPYSDGGMNHVCVMKGYDNKGTSEKNIISMSVGTSGAIRKYAYKPYLKNGLWCYSLRDGFIVGGATASACNIVDVYKERYFSHLSYDEIEGLMQSMTLHEKNPIYLPFENGERSPGYKPNRKGGFCYVESDLDNFNEVHIDNKILNSNDVLKNCEPLINYMAVLEGVLFNLYQCYELLLEDEKQDEEKTEYNIILSGGILNSKAWTAMCCDIFNTPIIIDHKVQSSLFGGLYMALNDEEIDKVKDAVMIYPDRKRHEVYMKRYEKYKRKYNE